MDGFDWFEIFTRVSPKQVVSVVLITYIGLLYLNFGPACDLFDWAVQRRV